MNADQAETLEVLREVWRGQSRSTADLDDGREKTCKRMSDAGVGFDDFGGGCEEDRIAAWRARLEREGKLTASGTTLREIVLGKGNPR